MTVWKNELETLQQLIDAGITLEAIGEKYDVTKQRIYQVILKFGLRTPVYKRKSFLREKGLKTFWLDRILRNKKIEKLERLAILTSLNLPDFCPILDLELNYSGYGEGTVHWDSSPSVDRIDSSKGYTIDNIQIISWRANRIKNDSTPEELKKIANYMLNLTK
jgi:hypothetical protein